MQYAVSGASAISDPGVFVHACVFAYVYISNKVSWVWDQSLNINFIYVSSINHTCGLYFLCTTLDNFVREIEFHGMELYTWDIIVALQTFSILDVWITDVKVLSSKSKI